MIINQINALPGSVRKKVFPPNSRKPGRTPYITAWNSERDGVVHFGAFSVHCGLKSHLRNGFQRGSKPMVNSGLARVLRAVPLPRLPGPLLDGQPWRHDRPISGPRCFPLSCPRFSCFPFHLVPFCLGLRERRRIAGIWVRSYGAIG